MKKAFLAAGVAMISTFLPMDPVGAGPVLTANVEIQNVEFKPDAVSFPEAHCMVRMRDTSYNLFWGWVKKSDKNQKDVQLLCEELATYVGKTDIDSDKIVTLLADPKQHTSIIGFTDIFEKRAFVLGF